MYADIANAKKHFEADQKQIERKINTAKARLLQSPPVTFNELSAAEKLVAAKSSDRMNGTNTADTVAETIATERQQAADKMAAYMAEKAETETELAKLEAERQAIINEITLLSHKLDQLIIDEAKNRRSERIAEYGNTASALLNSLIEIDALNIIIGENNGEIMRHCVAINEIPSLGLTEAGPWQAQHYPNKLVFLRQFAGDAVMEKMNALNKTIQEELYASSRN